MKKFPISLLGLASLVAMHGALADCAADATVNDVRRSHARAQQLEKSGDARGALSAYVAAQAYTCNANPVAAEAARRGAALGRTLGDTAKASGNHIAAFEAYEQGGHFAAADRELLARVQAAPDDSALYALALRHVRNRSLPAFQANEAVRIGVTGAYSVDAELVQAVAAMPARATDRALAAEAAAFNEAAYAQYITLVRAQPENPGDFAGMQQYASRMQAFLSQQRGDPLQDPVKALGTVREWEMQLLDNAQAAGLAHRRAERAESRAALLTRKYSDAPKLLQLALDYLAYSGGDSQAQEPRMLQVRRQAEKLGDAALANQRLQLAVEYFDVAGANDKAELARSRYQALGEQQMQPTIQALQRNAEALKAQFSDPAYIAELQRQALEAQRALKSSR